MDKIQIVTAHLIRNSHNYALPISIVCMTGSFYYGTLAIEKAAKTIDSYIDQK